MKKKTTQEFIKEAISIHNNEYDYSKVKYEGAATKVCIICKKHGEFFQTPTSHLSGCGCPQCRNEDNHKRFLSNQLEFISKANAKHEGKYDYSKVDYKGSFNKICIICSEHGEFWQTPHNHLTGRGCPKCGIIKTKLMNSSSTNEFITKSNIIHNNKYDYSKVSYVNAYSNVCIVCPIHGEFWQTPTKHLCGGGCSKCNGGIKISQKEFIEKAKLVHNNEYDYSKVNYINTSTKVCIICPKHGEFWQTPTNHIHKTQPQGCPKCKSSKMENSVRKFLEGHNIQFEEQKRFHWLGLQSLDFYIPSKNIAIECQGEQHFKPIDVFGGDEALRVNIERDKRKYNLCKEHNVKILYYINEKFQNEMNDKLYFINLNDLLTFI